MAEVNDRVSDNISHHSTREAIECMFNDPRILFRSIYSNSELELQSEELGNDQDNDCCVKQRSSDKDTDSNSEVESSTTKKLRLSKSPKKLANCNGHPSSSCPGRLLPFVSKSTSAKKKTLVCAKAKSKSSGHTLTRPSSEINHPKKKLTVHGSMDQSTKDACVDDLGNIWNLLTEVLKRLEKTEAKLESVEHKLESSTSLSSTEC